jgi:hypothetical protein
VSLQRVHDDGVLVDVVHRDARQMAPLQYCIGQPLPRGAAGGENVGALRVVGNRGYVRAHQHQMYVLRCRPDVSGEGRQHAGHVLEPVPATHLDDKWRLGRRWL